MAEQIVKLNTVTPTGMKAYLERARGLLERSRLGVNPFASYKPEIPNGFFLKPGEQEFANYEAEGLKEAGKLGLVLIAGGLGERLGYSSIKIGLPVCTIQPDYCYLKYYTNYVHALREKALPTIPESQRDSFYVPFCILVSGDTHD